MTPTAATRTKLAQLHPDLRVRVEALILECPHAIGITSAWRSRERQAELYRLFKAGKGNPANPPGMSKHEREIDGQPAAEAADLRFAADARSWAHANAARFGLHFPIRRESWHVESNGQPFTAPQEDDMSPEDLQYLKDSVGVLRNALADALVRLERLERHDDPHAPSAAGQVDALYGAKK